MRLKSERWLTAVAVAVAEAEAGFRNGRRSSVLKRVKRDVFSPQQAASRFTWDEQAAAAPTRRSALIFIDRRTPRERRGHVARLSACFPVAAAGRQTQAENGFSGAACPTAAHATLTAAAMSAHQPGDTFSLQMSNKSELAQQRVRRFNRVFSALGGAALSIACSARLHAALSAPSSRVHEPTCAAIATPLPSQGLLHKEHNNMQRREDERQRRHSGRPNCFRGSACPVHRVSARESFHKTACFCVAGSGSVLAG